MRPAVLVLAALCLSGESSGGASAQAPSVSSGSITYIANEGVLLEGGGRKVLIDALYGDYGRGFSYPTDSTQRQLMAASGSFTDVSAILATHRHGDHFNAVSLTAHLRANPRATFVAQPQVIDSLRRYEPARSLAPSRLRGVRVPVGERRSASVDGISIELLGVPHTGMRNRLMVQHLGYLVTLGGQRILHLGDAGIDEDVFRAWRLDTARVDYALVPNWMVSEAEGRDVINRWIKPRVTVAIHLGEPTDARAAAYAASLAGALPDLRVFFRSLERITW